MMSSPICLDASFLIRVLTPNPDHQAAKQLYTQFVDAHQPLIAPTLLAYETTAVLRRLTKLQHITPTLAQLALSKVPQLGINLIETWQVHNLSWSIAHQFGFGRTYDASYLAVSQLHNAQLWTADKKLYNRVHRQFDWVQLLETS